MSATHRRGFLQKALIAGAASSALARPTSAWAIPPIARNRPSRLKLSIAAYSYRQALTAKPPKMDMFGFVDLAADLGFDAVEPTSYYFPADADSDYIARFKRHAFVQGLDISGTAIGNNFCLPPGAERDKQLELTRLWIDRADAIDAPVIRIFAGNVPKGGTEDEAFQWAVECIKTSLEHAAKRGVILALENHGGITAKPAQLLKFVEAIDSPFFGINLDTGNFHGGDPYADIALLAPYALNVQVKTEVMPAGADKKQPADLARIIDILRHVHYSGYVVLEYEAAEDPFTAIPRYAWQLRRLL